MMAKTLREIACIVICLNIISAIFGIAYAINPTYTPVWDVFGVILLVTFFANPFLAYLFDRTVDKVTTRGRKINWVIYGYLLLMVLAIMGLLGSNFILSAVCADPLANLGGFSAGIYFSYFGIVAAGTIFACFAVKNSQPSLIVESTVPPLPKGPGPRRSVRLLVLFSCLFLFLSGIMFAVDILAGATIGVDPAFPPPGLIPAIFGVAAGVFAGFWAFILLIGTIFLLKITRRYRRPRISYGIGILGIFITGIMFVPLIATPASTPDADASFAAAFGSNWQDRIPASVEGFFMPSRFVLPGYYLGIPPKDCVIIPNISFYNGTTGVDAGITLFFDAYLPPNRGIGLPGGNSTIIRIHGGGWVSTDKGPQNMPQMSRSLAAQGYIVFDIQYGMKPIVRLPEPLQPAHVLGNFTVDDMVRHVGIFCQYLADHHADFGANLSSVFFMGGSAGGQLASAAALAIGDGNYSSYFGSALTIKGLVPFYPASAMVDWIDNQSTVEFRHPEQLVTTSSPPCLIFQGAQDGLVTIRGAQALQNAYLKAGNKACAVIWLPGAGHASDMYYSGYYTQFFQYYLERFLYMYR